MIILPTFLLRDHLQERLDPGLHLGQGGGGVFILQVEHRRSRRFDEALDRRNFKTVGVTIFVDEKNGPVYLEFLYVLL